MVVKDINRKPSLITKPDKKLIYEYLFREGCMVVLKNTKLELHPEIPVHNLHVMMTMKSLKSRNYVEERFIWMHLFYFINNSGIEYLRGYLHLPCSVFPATLTKKTPCRLAGSSGPARDRNENNANGGTDWRSRSGFGRGKPRQ